MLKEAIHGFSIVGLGVIASKLLSLISVYFVGQYLTPGEIGGYSIVFASVSVFTSLQNGAMEPLMIQRQVNSRGMGYLYVSIAVIINFLIIAIGFFWLVTHFKGEYTKILNGLAILLFSFSSAGLLFKREKYLEQKSFFKVTALDSSVLLIQYTTLIIALILMDNTLSYGISYAFASILGFILFPYREFFAPKLRAVCAILNKSKWLILSSFFSNLVLNSPYIIIGYLENSVLAGTFYFVNQCILSLVGLAARPIQSVLMPILSDRNDEEIIKRQFIRLVNCISILIILGNLTVPFFTGKILEHVWEGKWLHAEKLFVMSVVALGVRIFSLVVWVYSQSRGDWKYRPIALAFEFFVSASALVIVCLSTDDIEIIASVYYLLMLGLIVLTLSFMAIKYKINLIMPIISIGVLILWGYNFA